MNLEMFLEDSILKINRRSGLKKKFKLFWIGGVLKLSLTVLKEICIQQTEKLFLYSNKNNNQIYYNFNVYKVLKIILHTIDDSVLFGI